MTTESILASVQEGVGKALDLFTTLSYPVIDPFLRNHPTRFDPDDYAWRYAMTKLYKHIVKHFALFLSEDSDEQEDDERSALLEDIHVLIFQGLDDLDQLEFSPEKYRLIITSPINVFLDKVRDEDEKKYNVCIPFDKWMEKPWIMTKGELGLILQNRWETFHPRSQSSTD
jgi:hypothetical protein